jgi:3-oxosteroid 1-dehydrogenase
VTSSEAAFDVVVVGSGAAGMTAALVAATWGLDVLLVEKADTFGGSAARSGGGVWIPGNSVLRKAGLADTPMDAKTYLTHVVDGQASAARQQAFLAFGPPMLDFVMEHSPLRFAYVPGYADYYPEAPGGMPKGRTIEPRPLDARLLGPERRNLNAPYLAAPANMVVTARDYKWLSLGTRHPRSVLAAARVGLRATAARARGQRLIAMGQALAAGLRIGLQQAGVPVWLQTPLLDLQVDNDHVTGVWVTHDGERTLVKARRGVVLATGGFERNEAMRKQYQRDPIGTEWTVGAAGNTGDGHEAGQRIGAGLALMEDAWWGPSIPAPGGPYFCLAERNLPGSIIVNGAGQRYVNECVPYVDAVHTMYDVDCPEAPTIPSWLVFDQRYRDRYIFAGRGPRQPLSRKWYAAEILFREESLAGLAKRIGVPAEALESTVERFNDFARSGHDADFARGESAYDQYYGDPRNKPNPCLGELAKPPFYAVQMVPGDLGTKGGLVTDERARVLRADGSVIRGLYAAGNVSAAVMGHSYAGAGATIGPAMTFGYIAALDLAGAG